MESQSLNQLEQRVTTLLKKIETLQIEKQQLQLLTEQQNKQVQTIKLKNQATSERIKNILNNLKQTSS